MLSINLKGVQINASYLPAQEDPAQKRARLPQENEDRKRPQGSLPPQSKGQSQAQLLRHTREQVKREYFQGGVIRPLGVCRDFGYHPAEVTFFWISGAH